MPSHDDTMGTLKNKVAYFGVVKHISLMRELWGESKSPRALQVAPHVWKNIFGLIRVLWEGIILSPGNSANGIRTLSECWTCLNVYTVPCHSL